MTRLVISIVVVGIALAGCRGLAPGASGAATEGRGKPPTASASPVIPATPPQSSATAADECSLGFGIAEVAYPGLREFARFSDGVVIAEVVSVGEFQYATETGERPSCEYIEESQAVFGIGRMIELEVEAPVAGRGRSGETLRYVFPGGRIGEDTSPGHHYGLQPPAVGDRFVALLLDPPFDADPGEGVLEIDVLELFEIANGRVITPDSSERITESTVRDVVRGAVPSPPPGG
jgi:hypothetical protein